MNTNDSRIASATNAPSSKAPLEQAILRLESEIGHLSSGLSELYSRLSPVLGVSNAKPTNPECVQPIGSSAAVEMVQQLAFVCSRLEV